MLFHLSGLLVVGPLVRPVAGRAPSGESAGSGPVRVMQYQGECHLVDRPIDCKVDAQADRAFQEGRDFGMQLALQTMSAALGQVGELVTASDRRLKAGTKRSRASKE